MSRKRAKTTKQQRPGGTRNVCVLCNKVCYPTLDSAWIAANKINSLSTRFPPQHFHAYFNKSCGWHHVARTYKSKLRLTDASHVGDPNYFNRFKERRR